MKLTDSQINTLPEVPNIDDVVFDDDYSKGQHDQQGHAWSIGRRDGVVVKCRQPQFDIPTAWGGL